MNETVIIKGEWFLPANTERRIVGVLTYNPLNGIELEIEEPLGVDEDLFDSGGREAKVILGDSREGKAVTLYSCFRTASSLGNNYKATWFVNQAFIGCHANGPSDIYFTEVVLQVRPLFLWLNSSGIQISDWHTPNISTRFTYTKPDDIYFPIDDKVSGELRFHNSFRFPSSYSESIQFEHWASVAIESIGNNDLVVSDLWEYARRFLNWLTVVTGYPHDVEKVSYFHKDLIQQELSDGTKLPQEVASYSKKRQVNKKPERPDQFLFDFPQIKSYMSDALTKWFSLYDSIEIVLQILSENMGRDIAFSEFHFKDIIQALEAFHRKRVRNERMPKADYEAYKNRVLSQITNEADRDFVQEKVKYGNEPTLKDRLSELIDRCNLPSLKAIIGRKKKFIWLVIENRNYLTHLDKTGKDSILSPVELYHLSEKALALLFVTVIGEIIPNDDFLDQILRQSRRFRKYI